jgi:PleD family two-component response regulator
VIRESDLLGRYGGEEFSALLLDTAPSVAVLERMRRTNDVQSLLARADEAHYRARRDGRNRVCLSEGSAATT